MTTKTASDSTDSSDPLTRRAIGFLNWGHALDHFVMLIFPTVVIGLEAIYGRPYSELIALGTASFVAFGVFSLPAGWLADRWSRRNMIALFFIGCGVSMIAAALSPDLITLAISLFMLGVFAAIYHPVGLAMLIELSNRRGRTLAFNGVCGNMGAALAAGITAALASFIGWRSAFLVPAIVSIITGIAYLMTMPDDRHETAKRKSVADVRLSQNAMIALFGCFILVALTAGLAFNIITVALPKIVDERIGRDMPLLLVGSLATSVFFFGAAAQLAMGRLSEKFEPHILLAIVAVIQFTGVLWASYATGWALMAALAFAMMGIYGQVTVNDLVIARYTADAWRGRFYAVRFFLVFITSGAAVALIAFLHGRGGFDLVLMTTAAVAGIFLVTVGAIVAIIASTDAARARAPQAAE